MKSAARKAAGPGISGNDGPSVHCYAEMNAKIVEMLRLSGTALHLYAAQRIEDLEREIRTERPQQKQGA